MVKQGLKMSNFTFATIVITEADKSTAQADLGPGYFSSALSPTGTLPVTHYLASGAWDNTQLNNICNNVWLDTDNTTLRPLGWTYTIQFGDNWQGFLDTLGLKPVQEQE